jgi:hypothetical protein
MGKNQLRLLKFAIEYPTWHTYGKDRSTVDAIRSLDGKGLIVLNEFRQFRIAIKSEYLENKV